MQAAGPAEVHGGSGFDRFERRPSARAHIPAYRNIAFAAALLALNLVLFLILPTILLPQSIWWAFLLVPVWLTAPLHWALIHEATHRLIHPNALANRLLGRCLSILFLCPFDILRIGHLCHHALNGRASDRPEIYDPETTPRWRAALVYYFRLVFGLYLVELFCTLLIFLPRPILRRVARSMAYEGNDDSLRIPDIAERQLTSRERVWPIRVDAVAIVALWSLAIWLYGWMVWIFLIAVLLRGTLVSLYDNAPHYGVPLGDIHQGHDMTMPASVRWLVLNANFHGTHHRNPTLPWTALAPAFHDHGGRYGGSYFSAPLRQIKGVIPRSELAVQTGSPSGAPTISTG